jgi:hypothetical protein
LWDKGLVLSSASGESALSMAVSGEPLDYW